MSKALIISDELNLTNQLDTSFRNIGWTTEGISLLAMLKRGSEFLLDKCCTILVVDTDLIWFGGLSEEMDAFIKNFARNTSLYLIFKGEYEPIFDNWVKHAKKVFKATIHPQNAQRAIEDIILFETSSVPGTGSRSQMNPI